MSRRWALLSAALLGLAIPPVGAHPLLWIAWVPLLRGLSKAPSRSEAAGAGAVFGAAYYALLFHWMLRLSWPVYIGAVLAGAVFAAVFALAVYQSRSLPRPARAAAAAAAWTAPLLVALNPWRPFWGTTIFLDGIHCPLPAVLMQLARPCGEIGLSFFVVLVNGLLNEAWESVSLQRGRYAAAAAGLVVLSAVGGWLTLRALPSPAKGGFRLACAQHDLPFDNLWRSTHPDEIFRAYESMALDAAKGGANMVLFPQYQIPEDIYRKPGRWAELAKRAKLYLALGTYTPDEDRSKAWVISLIFSPEGKMIGEQRALHPSPISRSGVLAGDKTAPIAVPGFGGVAILPCFDDVTPRPAQRFARSRDLSYILAIANDSLFAGTIHPELHLIRSRLRAVESRKYVVRCTPGGISAVIDPGGRVVDSLPSGRGLLWHDF